eukprot:180211_1
MASNELQGYKIQGIYYLNKRTHRIQQNVGGACPLLALCNTLFLNHQIHYNKGGRRIKFEELTDCLTQHLQNMLNVDSSDGHKHVQTELKVDKHKTPHKNNDKSSLLSDEDDDAAVTTTLFDDDSHDEIDMDMDMDMDTEEDKMELKDKRMHTMELKEEEEEIGEEALRVLEECVQLFPKLEEGLDINIQFSDGCDFEENPGHRMFAHYGFKLFHGWVVDPKDSKLHSLIGDKSYDETIDLLISDAPAEATEEEKLELEENKSIIRAFFAESATQLTSYGLERLYHLMDVEDILAIFFRNNHFSTIVKHAGIMYEFVTDEGIVDADPQITWQTLLQISGDEQFVNNKFQSIHTNMSQYTQLAQYNRIKFEQDTGGNASVVIDESGSDELIAIITDALDYIDCESFVTQTSKKEDSTDPLVSHGLTQRTSDTLDRFLCRDFVYGIVLRNDAISERLRVRSFMMSDAAAILNLMSTSHDASDPHYKNIDFMHDDAQFALVIESHESNRIVGCCKYEWTKFNFWDWRESDWEDYEHHTKYARQRILRESGVRCDYFVHILDLAIETQLAHRGAGSQLLQCLVYAFPSHSKFGVQVPAANTPAVKCFTKCGFTIARVEQSLNVVDTTYKMTAESSFSIASYRSFVHNSIVSQAKESACNEQEEERVSLVDPPQLDTQIHAIEEDATEDDDIDIMSGLFGAAPPVVGDNFIFTTLLELNLTKYNQIFTDFNINKEALLHLDSAVVECMIENEKDRNCFLDWLTKYKQPPSKPPPQHSTNMKTIQTERGVNTEYDEEEDDADDHDQIPIR